MRKRWREVSTPLLVLHGEDDEATDPRASRRFFDAATSADKKFLPARRVPPDLPRGGRERAGDARGARLCFVASE